MRNSLRKLKRGRKTKQERKEEKRKKKEGSYDVTVVLSGEEEEEEDVEREEGRVVREHSSRRSRTRVRRCSLGSLGREVMAAGREGREDRMEEEFTVFPELVGRRGLLPRCLTHPYPPLPMTLTQPDPDP